MHALELVEEVLAAERPTVPAPPPLESGVRLSCTRVVVSAATVDVVVCDLTRDPRSEDYATGDADAASSQNESPPSTSTVRALK